MKLTDPGVLEAGLLSITRCPICSENLCNSLNQGSNLLFETEPWVPKFCPQHPTAWSAPSEDEQ
jgi:hypothetical protein